MPSRTSRTRASRSTRSSPRRRTHRRRTATLPLYASLGLSSTRSPSLQAALKNIVRAQSAVNAFARTPSLSAQTPSATRGASVPMLQSAVKQVISAQNTVSAFNQATNLGDGPAVSAAIVKATKPILTQLVTGDEQQQLTAALNTLENHFKQQAPANAIDSAYTLLTSTVATMGTSLLYILAVAVILYMTVSQCSQFRIAGCVAGLTLSYSFYLKLVYTIYMQFMNLGPFVAQSMATGTMYAIKLPYYTLSYGIMPIFNWVLGYLRSRGVRT